MSSTNNESTLHWAIREKLWQMVHELISQGADINMCNQHKETPLILALKVKDVPSCLIIQLISSQNINNKDADDHTALFIALQVERWNLADHLVQCGADVNNVIDRGSYYGTNIISPLHEAVKHTYVPIGLIEKLISSRNINLRDHDGCTALHLAIWGKRFDIVDTLLRQKADVNCCDMWRRTPLHYIVKLKDAPDEIIPQLISDININMIDEKGRAALHIVTSKSNFNLVPTLIQQGADINIRDSLSELALHKAVITKKAPPETIAQLISIHNVNVVDSNGCSALHLAAMVRPDLVPLLIHHGADINKVNKWNECPLHTALRHQDISQETAAMLTSSSNVNTIVQDETALHLAVRKNRWDSVAVLLHFGADVNTFTCYGSPLHEASRQPNIPVDCYLSLISPKNINLPDVEGRHPLYLIISAHRWDLIPILVYDGANINASCIGDFRGDYVHPAHGHTYPLHHAILYNIPRDTIPWLISSVNINLMDGSGQTPLHLASDEKYWELIPVLVQYGASIDICDRRVETPLHKAASKAAPVHTLNQLISHTNINLQNNNSSTALQLLVRNDWCLVKDASNTLLRHGAIVTIRDVILCATARNYDHDCVCAMLQHLSMTYTIRSMEFTLVTNHIAMFSINGTSMQCPDSNNITVIAMIKIICHLLQETCLVKAQNLATVRQDDLETDLDDNIVSLVSSKEAEFEEISRLPATLQKLCVLAIRQNLPCKDDRSFAELGLPPALLSLVTYRGLAEDINLIWRQGKKDGID